MILVISFALFLVNHCVIRALWVGIQPQFLKASSPSPWWPHTLMQAVTAFFPTNRLKRYPNEFVYLAHLASVSLCFIVFIFFKWPKSRSADGVDFHNVRLWLRGVRAADDCGPTFISVNSNIIVATASFGCQALSGWRHTVGRWEEKWLLFFPAESLGPPSWSDLCVLLQQHFFGLRLQRQWRCPHKPKPNGIHGQTHVVIITLWGLLFTSSFVLFIKWWDESLCRAVKSTRKSRLHYFIVPLWFISCFPNQSLAFTMMMYLNSKVTFRLNGKLKLSIYLPLYVSLSPTINHINDMTIKHIQGASSFLYVKAAGLSTESHSTVHIQSIAAGAHAHTVRTCKQRPQASRSNLIYVR